MALSSVVACLIVLGVVMGLPTSARLFSFSHFKTRGVERGLQVKLDLESIKHTPVQEAFEELEKELRTRRQAVGMPLTLGHYELGDGYQFARVHYSGNSSLAIFILTYSLNNARTQLAASHLYKSTSYGVNFTRIDNLLSPNANLVLWPNFYVNPVNKNELVFPDAFASRIYFTLNEGQTFSTQSFSPATLNPRSLLFSPTQKQWALAHDNTYNRLYVTEDLGVTWTLISNNVASRFDYSWADPQFDKNETTIYYNVFDPTEANRGNFTVGLYTTRHPYDSSPRQEFDPNLGRHDDFAIVGPYIFAQKTDSSNNIHLLVSYQRKSFRNCLIPYADPHQNYLVDHINALQAMVVVEHYSGMFNLYLSDTTGVDYFLSLQDIVVDNNYNMDLERINGVNGTWIANTYVRASPNVRNAPKRTVISDNNGGSWEVVTPPDRYKNGTVVNCVPPLCSLHFHMDTTSYARLGVYSLDTAPGIIVAHGTIGEQLAINPDLFISRDGGHTWNLTLEGSWGVSVLDQGGLMVAVRDYHQDPSTVLMYSCDEGMNWTSYQFKPSGNMTVFGVITEPGEYTTTVSLYGVERGHTVWQVVTVNFSNIFPRQCVADDYYNWIPRDAHLSSNCVLGATVVLERRRADRCCLNGAGYIREVNFTRCTCNEDDFECDYGFEEAFGLTGPCVRDPAIVLDNPCAIPNTTSYQQTRGYRKIAGDECQGGVSAGYLPYTAQCCGNNSQPPSFAYGSTPPPYITDSAPPFSSPSSSPSSPPSSPPSSTAAAVQATHVTAIALGVILFLTFLVAVALCVVVIVLIGKHGALRRRYLRLATSGMEPRSFHSMSEREDSPPPSYRARTADIPTQRADDDDDDDDPIAL